MSVEDSIKGRIDEQASAIISGEGLTEIAHAWQGESVNTPQPPDFPHVWELLEMDPEWWVHARDCPCYRGVRRVSLKGERGNPSG